MNKAELPVGWTWGKFGNVVDNHDSERIPIKLSERVSGEYPYYGASGIIDYVKDYIFDGKYLLISEDGANLIARTYPIAFIVEGQFWVNNHAHVVQPKPDVDINFLMYAFRQTDISEYITGSAQPKLSQRNLNKILIPLPPLEEQKRIAAIIDEQMHEVERARQAIQIELEAAEAMSTAYLREVFESEEAQEWEWLPIGKIANTGSGSTPSRKRSDYYAGSICWVKTGELKDGVIFDTEEHISELALGETSVKLLPVNTLLIAMYGQGQTRGRTALLGVEATTNQACFAIYPNDENFVPSYLQWWFRHSYYRLRASTEGRGGNQPNLNGTILKAEKVPLPKIPVQKRITEQLNDMMADIDDTKVMIQEKIEAIEAMPAAILRRAFSGEY